MSIKVDIQKSFPGYKLDVAFEAGNEVLGLLGASGCGKSLTLRCIAGIEEPDCGYIEVNGEVYFKRELGKKAEINLTPQQRKTALLFQNYMLFPNLTVEDNVAAGIDKNIPKEERQALIALEMKRFDIEGFGKRYPSQLSGGQQQRVALARMMAAKPGILMFDEPFSALDAYLKDLLEQNLVSLLNSFEGSILYVSHDIDEAMRLCDRIAVVDDGEIMELGTSKEIVSNPSTQAGIKLSGCKNITKAEYVNDHKVYLPRWDIEIETDDAVTEDIKFLGIRARHMSIADGPDKNCFRVRADRVTESRFDCTVLLGFIHDEAKEEEAADEVTQEMKYLHEHLFWRVDKKLDEGAPVALGDEFWIHIESDKIYLAYR